MRRVQRAISGGAGGAEEATMVHGGRHLRRALPLTVSSFTNNRCAQWTRKIYLYDRPSPPVPSCISRVCLDAVRSINWRSVFGRSGEWDSWHDSYQAEAGLLNFYQVPLLSLACRGRHVDSVQPRDMLTAHVDQAEGDATSPLVSISIGLSAIFLIGGRSKDVKPLPLLLRSGDVVIMAGPSRQAYHGETTPFAI